MKRFVQIALLSVLATPFGATGATTQENNVAALTSIRAKWEECLLISSAVRTPADGRIDYGAFEGAFSDCASEEKLILAAIDLAFNTESGRRQAVVLHYKRRVELKAKMAEELLQISRPADKPRSR